MEYRYQGIILSKTDIAEVDRIYNIYTREAGKIRVIGKGTRNPNAKLAGNLEPLTYAEIFISRTRGLGKITGAVAVDNFTNIKNNFEFLSEIFHSIGIFEKIITNEEKDEKVFKNLLEYLDTVNNLDEKKSEKAKIISLGYIFKLLENAGYGLNMEKCVRCGKRLNPEINYFSARSGGVICRNCPRNGERLVISGGAIKLIRIFYANKISNFSKISASLADMKNTKEVALEMIRWI